MTEEMCRLAHTEFIVFAQMSLLWHFTTSLQTCVCKQCASSLVTTLTCKVIYCWRINFVMVFSSKLKFETH